MRQKKANELAIQKRQQYELDIGSAYAVKDDFTHLGDDAFVREPTGVKTPLLNNRGDIITRITDKAKTTLGIPEIPKDFPLAIKGFLESNIGKVGANYVMSSGKLVLDAKKLTSYVRSGKFVDYMKNLNWAGAV